MSTKTVFMEDNQNETEMTEVIISSISEDLYFAGDLLVQEEEELECFVIEI